MPGQDFITTANNALHAKLGLSCKLTEIGKLRVKGNNENEISDTFVGRINNQEELKPNDLMWKDGKFLSVPEIKQLMAQKKTTPHLAKSLELYLAKLPR